MSHAILLFVLDCMGAALLLPIVLFIGNFMWGLIFMIVAGAFASLFAVGRGFVRLFTP